MSDLNEADFCFAVEDMAERSIELEIRAYDDVAKQHFQSVWQRLYAGLQNHHKICGQTAPEWTTWKPWDWCEEKKAGYERRIKYIAWCGEVPAGFLNVWIDVPSSKVNGQSILYLEHIAAAPGNQNTDLWSRRFKGIGAALFAYSVLISHQYRHEGRIGLHVADPDALSFYLHLHGKCENVLFHPQRNGIEGPTPRGAHDVTKVYLETQEVGATRWLEEYRRE